MINMEIKSISYCIAQGWCEINDMKRHFAKNVRMNYVGPSPTLLVGATLESFESTPTSVTAVTSKGSFEIK